ncbi:MAG: hypothetical protein WDO15_02045 [Bacteroidota bacterium]
MVIVELLENVAIEDKNEEDVLIVFQCMIQRGVVVKAEIATQQTTVSEDTTIGGVKFVC